MKISEVIKEIRLNLNLSQVAFAKQLGVSFSTVNRWENNKSVPNRLAINAIMMISKNVTLNNSLLKSLNQETEIIDEKGN